MRAFARGVGLAASLTCASCVPASEELPPAGALGFVTEPSPGTRGEPFVTSDGWTIRIEQLAVQARVSASPLDEGSGRSYGSSEAYRFDATKSTVVFARAIPAGAAQASITLNGSYLGSGIGSDSAEEYDEQTSTIGLSPEVVARFRTLADASPTSVIPGSYRPYNGPSLLLALRAERAGRVITLDLTLDVFGGYDPRSAQTPAVEVRGDQLVTTPITVAAEALFEDETTRVSRFDDFAAADLDGDGRVTGPELSMATSCDSCDGLDLDGPRVQQPLLLNRLGLRGVRMFVH